MVRSRHRGRKVPGPKPASTKEPIMVYDKSARVKCPNNVAQKLREEVPAQALLLPSDNSSKLRGLSQNNPRNASKRDEIFVHPPYSPDLAPSDFHPFFKLKEFLGGERFGSDEELENAVTTWLNELAAEEYDMGILQLVYRYDKCLNVGGDYAEK
ncbi:hypothetical protein AVEN_106756-1 [Araneus ventricosus]|uniref:Histone-lysine N-methyltransferase SETMAR n=1 Tax=Araneus ventricosus TaxID=182803 RepID=A0A4Y2F465_ARAVE|nr:hypothetical protein AVEN_106756-1 [Araneus ventricosus]